MLSVRYLPDVICTSLLISVIITSTLSYLSEHVSTPVPYISDTGTIPPESCIFGLILNISWVLITVVVYIKYKHIEGILLKHNIPNRYSLNRRAFYIGLIAAFGSTIVGSFQETNVLIVHWVGAIMVFGLGTIYICMQTMLYITISPVIDQRNLTKLRVVLSLLSVVSFTIFFIAALVSYAKFQGKDYMKWNKEDGGFVWHCLSSISEYICAICITTFILTFTREFRSISVHEPEIFVEDKRAMNVVNKSRPNTGTCE